MISFAMMVLTYAGDQLGAVYQSESFLRLKTDRSQVVALQHVPAQCTCVTCVWHVF